MRCVDRDRLTGEQRTGGIDQLDHAVDSLPRRRVGATRGGPLAGGVTGADTEDRPSGRQQVEGGHRSGQSHGLPHASVDDAGADSDAVGDRGRGGEGHERRRTDPRVVGDVEAVEPSRLDRSRQGNP